MESVSGRRACGLVAVLLPLASAMEALAGNDYGRAVGADADLVAVAGVACATRDTSCDMVTAAFGKDTGEHLWTSSHDGGGLDGAHAVAVASEAVFVAGETALAGGGADFATLAYGIDGRLRWAAQYDGGGRADVARALSVRGETVLVAGVSEGPHGFDVALVAYEVATGAQRWVAILDTGGDDFLAGLVSGPDGSAYVAGWTVPREGHGHADVIAAAFDAAGTLRWSVVYDGAAGGSDVALALGLSGSQVVVAGSSEGAGTGTDALVLAYDAETGGPRWELRHDGGSDESLVALAAGEEGIFATGLAFTGRPEAGASDILALAADASGALRWSARHDGPIRARDQGHAIAIAAGQVVVAGSVQSGGAGNYDIAVIAHDPATGDVRWSAGLSTPGPERPFGIAAERETVLVTGTGMGPCVDPDPPGSVQIEDTGLLPLGTCRDIVVMALGAATGERLWSARLDAGQPQSPQAL